MIEIAWGIVGMVLLACAWSIGMALCDEWKERKMNRRHNTWVK